MKFSKQLDAYIDFLFKQQKRRKRNNIWNVLHFYYQSHDETAMFTEEFKKAIFEINLYINW